jgi:hypothetical protein
VKLRVTGLVSFLLSVMKKEHSVFENWISSWNTVLYYIDDTENSRNVVILSESRGPFG